MSQVNDVPDPEELTVLTWLAETVRSIGITLGMLLLWIAEGMRNNFFRLLDRLHIAPRRRVRASAYPPGPTRS